MIVGMTARVTATDISRHATTVNNCVVVTHVEQTTYMYMHAAT